MQRQRETIPVIGSSLPRITLVLGGARSGKSRFAETMIARMPPPWAYIATAEAHDEEMRLRIVQHRDRRAAGWVTIEAPLDLAGAIAGCEAGRCVLVDCLTLWLSNVMLAGQDVELAADHLLASLSRAPGPVVLVSNEVGLGIVPDNALSRRFRDAQGLLNQRIAALAGHVVLIAAGLPLILKSTEEDKLS